MIAPDPYSGMKPNQSYIHVHPNEAKPFDKNQPMIFRSNNRKKSTAVDKSQCVCERCLTKTTPQWRPGPNGQNTLCNACGLKWFRHEKSKGVQKADAASSALKKSDEIKDPENRLALAFILCPQNNNDFPSEAPR